MPTGLSGVWNLAGLQVPGVYIDIIPPSPNLVGVATNIVGIVGVGSWGPVNSIILASTPNDCAIRCGVPTVRTHDIATHVWASSAVGGAIGYNLVRVTDGTDTAATTTVGSGSAGTAATAVFTETSTNNFLAGDTVKIGGITYTFATTLTGVQGQVLVGAAFANSAANLCAAINGGLGANTNYVPTVTLPPATATTVTSTITVTANSVGTGGNTLASVYTASGTSAGSFAGSTFSGGVNATDGVTLTAKYTGTLGNGITATITAGTAASSYCITILFPNAAPEIFNNITGTGNALWVNIASAINLGNSYRGPSNYVVAAAGSSTSAPTLGSTLTLSGGTDGASGVTDTTMVGQDVYPRKGMYALRNSGVSAFTLVDLATSSLWPSLDTFALSEDTLACVATTSGDTIANAAATRTSVGLDDMWTWIAVGDWPTFYDNWNGLSRLVCPTAYQLGIVGNQSPEQSPLNKVLRGISATQTTQANRSYAYTDLSLLNTSGIDVIVGPPTTPGGAYYSWASGRNASSNTAANGVEYTTLTNFLARSADQYAAGSIIGQLQSIRPNDQTRAKAKALFDGFSAQLADPRTGSNGHGIIDTWQCTCDLTNNPPASQALGYLYLYWTVRYLNAVRYFVIKLAGGGNVTVTSQSTPPSPTTYT